MKTRAVEHVGMPSNRLIAADPTSLVTSAHELQRAAGNVQRHAAGEEYVPTLGITLAHVEEALDRLSVGMMQMANGVIERYSQPGLAADEDTLPPQARALCFHLRAAADSLHASQGACASSRIWTRRLLDIFPDEEHERHWADHGQNVRDARSDTAHNDAARIDSRHAGPAKQSHRGPSDDSSWVR